MKKTIQVARTISFEVAKEKISKERIQQHIKNDDEKGTSLFACLLVSLVFIGLSLLSTYLSKSWFFLFYFYITCVIGGIMALLVFFQSPIFLKMKSFLIFIYAMYLSLAFITVLFLDSIFLWQLFGLFLFFSGITLNAFISHALIKWTLMGYTTELKPTKAEKIVQKILVSLISLGLLLYLPFKELKLTDPQAIRDLNDGPIGEIFWKIFSGMGFNILSTLSLAIGSPAIIEGYLIGKYAEEFRLAYGFSKEEFYGKKYRRKK